MPRALQIQAGQQLVIELHTPGGGSALIVGTVDKIPDTAGWMAGRIVDWFGEAVDRRRQLANLRCAIS